MSRTRLRSVSLLVAIVAAACLVLMGRSEPSFEERMRAIYSANRDDLNETADFVFAKGALDEKQINALVAYRRLMKTGIRVTHYSNGCVEFTVPSKPLDAYFLFVCSMDPNKVKQVEQARGPYYFPLDDRWHFETR